MGEIADEHRTQYNALVMSCGVCENRSICTEVVMVAKQKSGTCSDWKPEDTEGRWW